MAKRYICTLWVERAVLEVFRAELGSPMLKKSQKLQPLSQAQIRREHRSAVLKKKKDFSSNLKGGLQK